MSPEVGTQGRRPAGLLQLPVQCSAVRVLRLRYGYERLILRQGPQPRVLTLSIN